MKKITLGLLVVCLLVAIVVSVGVATNAVDYTGSVTDAQALVDGYRTASSQEAKLAALQNIGKYLSDNPVNPKSEGYAELAAEYEEVKVDYAVTYLYADFEAKKADGGATMNVKANAFRTFNAFCKENGITESEVEVASMDGKEFGQVYRSASKAYSELMLAAQKALYLATPFREQTSTDKIYLNDFEARNIDTSTFRVINNNPGVDQTSIELDTNHPDACADESSQCLTITSAATGAGQDTYVDISFSKCKIASLTDTVMEFDITTFDYLPSKAYSSGSGAGSYVDKGIIFGPTETATDGRRLGTQFLCVNGNQLYSNYPLTGSGRLILAENFVVPGEWTHVTMCYDNTTKIISLYLDYEYVASYYACEQASIPYIEGLTTMRIDSGSVIGGSLSIDNLTFYNGTSPKSSDFLTNSKWFENEAERFAYYANYFSNEDHNELDRGEAYEYAGKVIGNFAKPDGETATGGILYKVTGRYENNAAVCAAIEAFNAFDYSSVIRAAKLTGLETYASYYEAVLAIPRTLDTIAKRQKAITTAVDFATARKEDDMIDTVNRSSSGYSYTELNARMAELQQQVDEDNIALSFVAAVNSFITAIDHNASFSRLDYYYANAAELINSGELTQANISYQLSVENSEFIAAYNRFIHADEELADKRALNNSSRFIAAIKIVMDYTTEEEWAENYDFISRYIKICRSILKNGLYNPDYAAGTDTFAKYYEIYEPMNLYFYNHEQIGHAEIIKQYLALYSGTESYIEKLGTCSYLYKYIEENDVDTENELIVPLCLQLEVYQSELASQREKYVELLSRNSTEFVNLVKMLKAYSNYSDMQPVFEEAMNCYYNMSFENPEVQEMIDVFFAYDEALKEIRSASEMFLGYVEQIEKAETADGLFAALSAATYYRDLLADTSYEGVEEGIKKLADYAEAYDALVLGVNGELSETADIVAAVRSSYGAGYAMAIILGALDICAD